MKTDAHILSGKSSKLQFNSLENTNCLVFINTVTSKKYWEDSIIAKIFRLWHSNAKNQGTIQVPNHGSLVQF